MRVLLAGLFGIVLLIGGLIAGVGGIGLQITHPCSPASQLSLQPADSVATPPDRTILFGSLTEYQQTAVEAAIDEQTRHTFKSRKQLEPLTEVVVEMEDGRYVADVIKNPCRSLYDELAIGGFAGSIIGAFVVMLSVVMWRTS